MKKIIYILLFIIGSVTVFGQTTPLTVPLRFDKYYSYEEMNEAMNLLKQHYPEFVKLDLVGKSDEGRDIWALTINNPKTGKELDKPGVYVDGNIHGNEIQATEVCLYTASYLLTNYKTNIEIKEMVDRNAFYFIPSVNVDGKDHFFKDGNTASSNRGLRLPKDDDKDGLYDEDGYDDLDKDGNITQMRIKDPFGDYKTDPEDNRLMVRVKPGEKGEWTILGSEGIDNDNDGRVNEDSEGYVDPNRNWGYNWKPNYYQRGAGYYPFSGQGLKAIAKYIMDRPNIIVAYAFHNNGGMYLRGPSDPKAPELPRADVATYDILGYEAEKIVPGYVYKPSGAGLYPTFGDAAEFYYTIAGAYAFVGELFQTSTETYRVLEEQKNQPKSRDETNRQRLQFNDHLTFGELYKPWTKINHPTYGEIEIGGWIKFSSRMPHRFMLLDLVHRNSAAVLFSASQTPEIEMSVLKKEKIGKDTYKLIVRLENKRSIPSMSAHSVKEKLYTQDILKVEGAKVIAGGKVLDDYTLNTDFKKNKPEVQFLVVPGNQKVDYQFIIEGKGNVELKYTSRKAGKINKTIKL